MNLYKPRTRNQSQVLLYLKHHFALDACAIWPVSLDGLLLEDQNKKQIAFTCIGNRIAECEIPPVGSKNAVRRFAHLVQQKLPELQKQTFEAKSDLWHTMETTITYQRALGLNDALFRHYLTHLPLSSQQVMFCITGGFVSDEDYRSILLWYLDGHTLDAHLVPGGVDGHGKYIDFAFHPLSPATHIHRFYLSEPNSQ